MAMDAFTASQLVQPGLPIDIQVILNGPPISLVQGEIDSIAMDVVNGVVSLEGRDFTGRLLDSRTEGNVQQSDLKRDRGDTCAAA